MIHEWGKHIAATFGVTGAVAIVVAFFALLPLNVVALTRLTGWDLAIALGAAIALNLIPVAGQLVYIGLAVAGAFYLGQDNLAERKATPPVAVAAKSSAAAPTIASPPAATASKATIDTFLEWKKTTAGPLIQNSCLQDAQRRGLVGGGQIEQMARACACYGAAAVNVIQPSDVTDGQVVPTPAFNERLGMEAKRICQG